MPAADDFRTDAEKEFVSAESQQSVLDGSQRRDFVSLGDAQCVIVDDEGMFKHTRFLTHRLLVNEATQCVVVFVIFLNCLAVGVELQVGQPPAGAPSIFEYFEIIFQMMYAAELAAMFFAYGCDCLHDHWVKFDMLVVAGGFADICVLQPLNAKFDMILILRVLRLLRLFRLARAMKVLVQFREMAILINGLLSSVGMMVYTLVLLTVMIFIFACAGQQLIGEIAKEPGVDPLIADIVTEHFATVTLSMLTLIQFVSMDDLAAVYKPIIMDRPWLSIYFLSAILVISIVLMNLVTAVMVNSAIDKAEQNKSIVQQAAKEKAAKLARDVSNLFYKLDTDADGELCKEEFMDLSHDNMMLLHECLPDMSPMEIFEAIDIDRHGSVDNEQFCQGIMYLVKSGLSPQMRRMAAQLDATHSQMNQLMDGQEALFQHFGVAKPVKPRRRSQRSNKSYDSETSAVVAASSDLPVREVKLGAATDTAEAMVAKPSLDSRLAQDLRDIHAAMHASMAKASSILTRSLSTSTTEPAEVPAPLRQGSNVSSLSPGSDASSSSDYYPCLLCRNRAAARRASTASSGEQPELLPIPPELGHPGADLKTDRTALKPIPSEADHRFQAVKSGATMPQHKAWGGPSFYDL